MSELPVLLSVVCSTTAILQRVVFSAYILAWGLGLPEFWLLPHHVLLVQEMLSSVRETQQGQHFLETQAAADQLQEHLAQSLQSCEQAVADESAKDEAFRQAHERLVVYASRLNCKSVECLIMLLQNSEIQSLHLPVAAYAASTC